ncbi:ABC transporter substrate-binding protein [Herbiconiux daphne]|uniref:ABC transporter substrate-binding protein n=1 Tax=Herbiconiux daphne TaxID=2970914 RepID=A0ABT2H6Z1_9MICO|nr:ABC transporter substrate-binding protein [Herbiconiux daphne]MCS5735720.1 ABC transporter substrate-binding protein [Herbiconiux daphne]
MTGTTTIKMAGGAQGFNWLPVFIAVEQGMLSDRRVEIEFLRLGSVEKATQAVQSGTADLAITPPEGAIANYVAGGDLRIIAANSLRLPMSLVASKGVGNVANLRGKRIGTSSLTEGTAVYVREMLQRDGLTYPADYEFVLSGIHTTRWTALRQGEIDCAPQPAPWNFLAEREGFDLIAEVSDVIPEVLFAALVGADNWLRANTDSVRRLVAALRDAHEFINDPQNDRITLPVYERITTPGDADLAKRGFDYTRALGMWPTRLVVPDAALRTSVDLMVRANLLNSDQVAMTGGVFDPQYVGVA